MALDLFKDIFNSLNTKDPYLMDGNQYPTAEKEYGNVAYMVNKGYSFGEDTILLAQEMNKLHDLDAKQQYDFYFHMIPFKKKRWNWIKKQNIKYIDIIQEYYNCSTKKAIEYLHVLSEEQIKIIEKRLYKGEIQKK